MRDTEEPVSFVKAPLKAQLAKSQEIVSKLQATVREQIEIIRLLEHKVSEYSSKANAFDTLAAVGEENAMVKKAWNDFLMILRLAGYDERPERK